MNSTVYEIVKRIEMFQENRDVKAICTPYQIDQTIRHIMSTYIQRDNLKAFLRSSLTVIRRNDPSEFSNMLLSYRRYQKCLKGELSKDQDNRDIVFDVFYPQMILGMSETNSSTWGLLVYNPISTRDTYRKLEIAYKTSINLLSKDVLNEVDLNEALRDLLIDLQNNKPDTSSNDSNSEENEYEDYGDEDY